jgi:hypothetical protein
MPINTGGGGGHIDMFAHNQSSIASQDMNRRPETVVDLPCQLFLPCHCVMWQAAAVHDTAVRPPSSALATGPPCVGHSAFVAEK